MEKNLKNIKLIVLDVDGTLTDGKIYYGAEGEIMKAFNVKDGFAISDTRKMIKYAIITGLATQIVDHRAKRLGIDIVYQGIENKYKILKEIMENHNLKKEEVAYIGDGINDLSVLPLVHYFGAPKNSNCEVLDYADFVSDYDGGSGAVYQFVKKILIE